MISILIIGSLGLSESYGTNIVPHSPRERKTALERFGFDYAITSRDVEAEYNWQWDRYDLYVRELNEMVRRYDFLVVQARRSNNFELWLLKTTSRSYSVSVVAVLPTALALIQLCYASPHHLVACLRMQRKPI
jgi:hypothetical protein